MPIENLRSTSIQVNETQSETCLICGRIKLLCRNSKCKNTIKTESIIRNNSHLNSNSINGSTPPGIFVGHFGYPKVHLSPMLPPYYGDTEILDTPERWFGKSIDEIVDYRYSLIRASKPTNVFDVRNGGKFIEMIQELAMASKPIDLELQLTKKPQKKISFNENSRPFGPSAPLRSLKTPNISVDGRIEKAYYDKDQDAKNSICKLYRDGVLVTRIQKAFSTGNLGIGRKRKMVPTKWSITTVDDVISLALINEIKQHPTIDNFQVYTLRNLDNIYVTILLPQPWKFEWVEAWFPTTTWNKSGLETQIIGDYEGYSKRKTYARVGGCYYSTRLATAEALSREKRQAGAILLREIHPGYTLPIGVWNVRESIREQLKQKPITFDDINNTLRYAFSQLTIPANKWIANSSLLKEALYQKMITEF